ncbi:MAG TPA: hypothetical protein PKE29_09660 [Phycisphaerales bacterium]|nr:hypothetical protein [Phycisphaerales bacterium]
MKFLLCAAAALAVLGASASLSLAQWTNNAASPLVVGDPNSDIPVVVPTPDGGCYIAWQGPIAGSMWNTVHLQRLDAAGHEMWPHNGIVAVPGNNSASFVGDFDLAIASDGDALIANSTNFSDPANPTVHQANVQKFSAVDGSKVWGGGTDVAVTTGTFAARPVHVCSTSDGGCIVGYTLTTASGNGVIRFRRIGPAGGVLGPATTPAFANPQILENGGNDSLSLTQMIPAGSDGSFIALLGWKVNTSQVGLQTQKFTGAGAIAPGWGTSGNPLTLDTRGLTGFNFYLWKMVPDGADGAVYGWSTFANNGFGAPTDAVLQHVLSNGAFKFGTCCDTGNPPTCTVTTAADCTGGNVFTPGAAPVNFVSPGVVDPTRGRYAAAIDYNPTDGTYFMGTEQGPTASGVKRSALVQKFDASGNRLWSGSGFTVVPESTSNTQITPSWIKVQATSDGGCLVFGNMGRGFTTINAEVYGAKVNTDFPGFGGFVWNKIVNSDVTTGKGRNGVVRVAGTDDAIVVHSAGSTLRAARIAATDGAPAATSVPPSIDVDVPTAVSACEGDTVTISVQVSGTQPMVFAWQRHYAYQVANPDAAWGLSEGDSSFQCILPDDGTTYSGTNTATLTIHNIHANNPSATCPNSDPSLNQYRVVIYNAASDGVTNPPSTASSWAQITVGSGACCAADGSCASVCVAAGCAGVFQGVGSACLPNPCGGACCEASACTITGAAGCAGAFQGNGTTCAPSPCPGACCDSSTGACTEAPGASSCGSGSTFQAFAPCTPQPCPQPGACCGNSSGACTTTVGSACSAGSTFLGAGSSCATDPCSPTGACCSNIDGNYCAILTQTACTGISTRRWQGTGTVCSPSPCPQPAACCNQSTGACTVVAAPGCGAGSTFQGDGTVCQPNPCPQPGACCDASTGACTVVASASQCGGQSVAAGSCEPNPCPTPIACCSPGGCSLSLPNFCGNPAPGGATTCSPSPCDASGTCCRGATCATTFASAGACAGSLNGALAGASFIPSGVCNTASNSRTPCCYGDYNKVNGLAVQDIFDFLNDWFAGRPFARFGGDGSPGTLAVQDIFDFLNAWFAGCP